MSARKSNETEQGDVQTLIEAVKAAKQCDEAYRDAREALGAAQGRIVSLIGGGDYISAIHNGQKRIGEILTRLEDED